jgi:hypothetical protein
VAVVIPAIDVAKGEVLTTAMLSSTTIPWQFVTTANVLPVDLRLVLGRKVAFDLRAGDPLLWNLFADVSRDSAARECAAAIQPAVDEAGRKALEASLEKVRAGVLPVTPAPIARPLFPDADGLVGVVGAVRKLEPGVLTRADLVVRHVPVKLVTDSWVPADELGQVVGARLLVPLAEGDAVWWQMLDDAEHLATAIGCATSAEQEILARKNETADEQAARWFDEKKPRGGLAP